MSSALLNAGATQVASFSGMRKAEVSKPVLAARNSMPRRRAGLVVTQAGLGSHKPDSERVVITGMGIVSVFGNDCDTFYEKLLAGTNGVGPIDRFDVSEYPTNFAAQIRDFDNEGLIDKKSARRYDDCIKYAMVAAKKALSMSGLEVGSDEFEKINKQRAGVLIGSGMGGLTTFQDGVSAMVQKGVRKISPFFIPYAITNMSGALVGIETGFMGPNYSISTACATANYAYVSAANHIRNGDADIMLAGGAEAPIMPVGLGGFVACRALSTRCDNPETASRPWDQGRDGFVMGEGSGVLVMESLEHAKARGANIVCEYLGGGLTCDAHHMTDPHPDGVGVCTCIEHALADAGIEKADVNYINAHATSTLVGDIAEVKAIRKAFDNDVSHLKMNGTKSMIGHGLGAAAALESIATIQAIRYGEVHPTINNEDPIPDVEGIDCVFNVKQKLDVKAAMSNSFGFGGHNSSVIFGAYED